MGELEAIVQRMIDAGEPEENIALVIREFQTRPQPPAESGGGLMAAIRAVAPAALGGRVDASAFADPATQQAVGDVAPAGLSILGGMVGGIPGAGGGAALGSMARQASRGEPISLGETAKEGALGAAGQAAGPLIGKGIQKAGRALGRGIIRATIRPSAAVRREFGGAKAVADTILDERALTSGQANQAMRGSRAAALRAVRGARGSAAPIQPSELIDDVAPVARRSALRNDAGMVDDTTDSILDQLTRMERRNPGGIRVDKGQRIKEELQGLSSSTYKARNLGHDVNSLDAEATEGLASGMRRAIERRVPQVAQQNARTQRLIGARRALAEAEDRPAALTNMLATLSAAGGAVSGNLEPGILGAMAIRAMSSPMAGTASGIAANEAGRLLGNPALNRAALLATLLGQE